MGSGLEKMGSRKNGVKKWGQVSHCSISSGSQAPLSSLYTSLLDFLAGLQRDDA